MKVAISRDANPTESERKLHVVSSSELVQMSIEVTQKQKQARVTFTVRVSLD